MHRYTHTCRHSETHSGGNTVLIQLMLSAECVTKKWRRHTIEPRRYNSCSVRLCPGATALTKRRRDMFAKGAAMWGKLEAGFKGE